MSWIAQEEIDEVVKELQQIAAVRDQLKVGWFGGTECQGEEPECWSCKAVLLDRGLAEFEAQLHEMYGELLPSPPKAST